MRIAFIILLSYSIIGIQSSKLDPLFVSMWQEQAKPAKWQTSHWTSMAIVCAMKAAEAAQAE
jgi:hypothetical protein